MAGKAKKERVRNIVLATPKGDVHMRYIALTKKIKARGYAIAKTVPDLLVDALEAEEQRGFEGLKKYI